MSLHGSCVVETVEGGPVDVGCEGTDVELETFGALVPCDDVVCIFNVIGVF